MSNQTKEVLKSKLLRLLLLIHAIGFILGFPMGFITSMLLMAIKRDIDIETYVAFGWGFCIGIVALLFIQRLIDGIKDQTR